jgi:hypothetical protein
VAANPDSVEERGRSAANRRVAWTGSSRGGHLHAIEREHRRLPHVHGRLGLVPAIAVVSALAVACGDDDEEQRRVSGTPDPGHVKEVERNPYAVTCGDLVRQTSNPESARLVIHAEFALAQDPVLKKVVAKQTLNRTGRSVYFAMTEICKGREASFKPARLAVEGVRTGQYRAAKGRPG